MKASVIFCNDSAEFVMVGFDDEVAQAKLEELAEALWQRERRNFESREEYRHAFYWYIRYISAEVKSC